MISEKKPELIISGEYRVSALRSLRETAHYKDAPPEVQEAVEGLEPPTLGKFLQEFQGSSSLAEILQRTIEPNDQTC